MIGSIHHYSYLGFKEGGWPRFAVVGELTGDFGCCNWLGQCTWFTNVAIYLNGIVKLCHACTHISKMQSFAKMPHDQASFAWHRLGSYSPRGGRLVWLAQPLLWREACRKGCVRPLPAETISHMCTRSRCVSAGLYAGYGSSVHVPTNGAECT